MIKKYDNITIIASEKKPYFSFTSKLVEMSAYLQKDCYLLDTIDMVYGKERFGSFIRPHKVVRRW